MNNSMPIASMLKRKSIRSCINELGVFHVSWERLTSWLLFVMFIVSVLLSHLLSWVRCGTELYRFLIFAVFLTSTVTKDSDNRHAPAQSAQNPSYPYIVWPFFCSMHLSYAFAPTRETLSLGVSEQQRRRPACAIAQSDQRLRYLFAIWEHRN